MKAYAKGSKAERDLLHYLNFKGFATLRMPSSGGHLYPLDLIALRKDVSIAFEIKSWKKMPKIQKAKLEKFDEWCRRAGTMGFVAWRMTGGEWRFMQLSDALAGRYEDGWITLKQLSEVFGF